MANEDLINLLGWCRRERESLGMQREMLQSGKFRIFNNEGSGPVDVSADSIERLTANIAELDQILGDNDEKTAVRSRLTSSTPRMQNALRNEFRVMPAFALLPARNDSNKLRFCRI